MSNERGEPRPPTDRLLLFAGLLTWAAVGVPYVVYAFSGRLSVDPGWWTWLTAHLGFGALVVLAFLVGDRSAPVTRRPPSHRLILLGQALCALVVIAMQSEGLVMILLVIVAAQVPFSNGLGRSLIWIGVQTAIGASLAFHDLHAGRIAVETGTHLGFQLFAVYASTTAVREQSARRSLAETNAELISTRELLAGSSRLAERRRISRELHDLLGHHLTALILQLEAAAHRAEWPLAEQLREARSVAGELLEDVRRAVRSFRADQGVDLSRPLRLLATAVPSPRVHLELPESLEVEDPVRANALLRSVQEVVTNAARHSGARNLWVTLKSETEGIRLEARDDGRGAKVVRPGAGLEGLEERLTELGGRLRLEGRPGRGFALEAFLPIKERAE